MDERKLLKALSNVLTFYYETIKLKEVERSGWVDRNISRDKRVESVPEHVYSTQQLALAIYSEFDLDIDIYKVICMISVHETEEIYIGDLNPFSGVLPIEKARLGKLAIDKATSCLRKKSFITSLIDEFNERETPEAQFAYLCDKMDADAMAKKYDDEGRFSLDMLPSKILKNERTQKAIENGAKTVGEIFIESDVLIYEGNEIFSELIQFLKKYSIVM